MAWVRIARIIRRLERRAAVSERRIVTSRAGNLSFRRLNIQDCQDLSIIRKEYLVESLSRR